MPNFWTLDDQTRRDLDLDAVEARYNRTLTSFGDRVFAQRLGQQTRELAELRRWADRLRDLRADDALRGRAPRLLGRLGKQRRGQVFDDLGQGLDYRPRWLGWMPLWFVAGPVLSVLAVVFLGPWALYGALAPALINLVLYLRTNPHIGTYAGSFQYLLAGIGVLDKLGRLEDRRLLRLGRYGLLFQDGSSSSVSGDLLSMVLDYVRTFLGAELLAYARVAAHFDRLASAVPEAMDALGELDVLLCLADLLDDEWLQPEVGDAKGLHFDGLRHPLVDDAVAQSFHLDQNLVITGMNMAGKSTFLKSVALAQVMATGLGVVRAQSFTTGTYLVMTSLNLADDVLTGRSRYYVEAERLLALQQALAHEKLLCLIDEILTGTNTDDRILASLGILTNFAQHGTSLILAATHDTAIAEGLDGLYRGISFDGEWDEGRLVFDYQPRPGIQTRRNALKLLEMLGLDYRL